MTRRVWLFTYAIGVVWLLATAACGGESSSHSSTTRAAEDWASINLGGGYLLLNNVWNKAASQSDVTPFQEIFAANGEDPSFGWRWRWSDNNTTVVSYPEVQFGTSPWNDVAYTQGGDLPFVAGSKKVTVDYAIWAEVSGVFNLAFDIWAVTNLTQPKSSISHEIMIWIDHSPSMTPAGSQIDTLTVDNVVFSVHSRPSHGDASGVSSNTWDYIAFVAETPMLTGTLELSAFIDYMVEEGMLSAQHYIANVELGNEVVAGTGTTEVSSYVLTFE